MCWLISLLLHFPIGSSKDRKTEAERPLTSTHFNLGNTPGPVLFHCSKRSRNKIIKIKEILKIEA